MLSLNPAESLKWDTVLLRIGLEGFFFCSMVSKSPILGGPGFSETAVKGDKGPGLSLIDWLNNFCLKLLGSVVFMPALLKLPGVRFLPGDELGFGETGGFSPPIRNPGKKFGLIPGDAGLEGALPNVIGSI